MNPLPVLCGLSLLCLNVVAAACEQPALVVIPTEQSADRDSAQTIGAMQRYIVGVKEYLACVQLALDAAGGDAAPSSVRSALIHRNNAAVAETKSVVAFFTEHVAPMEELYLAEFIAGTGEECAPTVRLESTAVVSDLAVIFIERSGRTYLNVLEGACSNLVRYGDFEVGRGRVPGAGRTWSVESNRVCSKELIYPYAFDGSSLSSRPCSLGRFFELTQEQTVQLMESRPARASVQRGDGDMDTRELGAESDPANR